MKKKILRGIIIFIIILLTLLALTSKKDSIESGTCTVDVVGYKYKDKYGKEQKIKETSRVNLENVSHVKVKGGSDEKDYNKTYGNILRQYNVFCVDKSAHHVEGWYKVGAEHTCEDEYLKYILYQSAKKSSYSNCDEVEEMGYTYKNYRTYYQRAFWDYLYINKDNNNGDINNILGERR